MVQKAGTLSLNFESEILGERREPKLAMILSKILFIIVLYSWAKQEVFFSGVFPEHVDLVSAMPLTAGGDVPYILNQLLVPT